MRRANAPSTKWTTGSSGGCRHWCRRRHPNKSWTWIKKKYFRSEGHRHWIFTGTLPDKDGKGIPIALMEAGRVAIRRFVKIRSDANPYDPEWEPYLEERLYWQTGRNPCRSRSDRVYLWKSQEGRCRTLWPTAANQRETLAHASSALA